MAQFTMVGYGLSDLVENDPRVNWKSILLDYDREGEVTIDNYLRFVNGDEQIGLEAFVERWKEERPHIRVDELFDCVRFGGQNFGLPNVICIRPVAFKDWVRMDDIISDSYENVLGRAESNTVDILNRQPWPFVGEWTDLRTGNDVRNMDAFEWTTLNIEWPRQKKARNMSKLNQAACNIGFSSHEDAVKNLVPKVPHQIRQIVKFGDLFTSGNVVNQLSPMLYRFLT